MVLLVIQNAESVLKNTIQITNEMLEATCFNDGNEMMEKYEKNYVLIHLNISCHISHKPNG